MEELLAKAPAPAQERDRPRSVRITDRDRELLGFIADHRLVLAAHARALLGVSASVAHARLRALCVAGMLSHQTLFYRQPAYYQITRRGLALIGSGLPPPKLDLRCYEHDIGLAWLWLAARAGAFGELREVISERQLRSRDSHLDREAPPLAVRLGGFGPRGRERLHYPDLLLRTADGHRIALELELSGKGAARREKIIAGYAADARIDAVVYLVHRRSVARGVRASAARIGVCRLVHVQSVRCDWLVRSPRSAATPHRIRAAARRVEVNR